MQPTQAEEGAGNSSTPMDVDPIDGGPRPVTGIKPSAVPTRPSPPTALALMVPPGTSTEEEARQAIEMLRSDDLSARVLAAHRLDSVAAVLGEERTREVHSSALSTCSLSAEVESF
jgi:hypothetical protein